MRKSHLRSLLTIFLLWVFSPAFGGECVDLFDAIEEGDFHKAFKLSLQQEPQLGSTCKNNHGENAMHVFVDYQANANIFALLFYWSGADVNAQDHLGETPLMRAARKNNLAAAFLLLSRRARMDLTDKGSMTAFAHAVKAGHGMMAELLRNCGCVAMGRVGLKATNDFSRRIYLQEDDDIETIIIPDDPNALMHETDIVPPPTHMSEREMHDFAS